jgi:anthranilate synthase component I
MDLAARTRRPFGPPALEARARIAVLPAESCAAPLAFFRTLRAERPGRGAALMESAAQGPPAGIRSLIIPEAPVRLVVRRGEATYTPLSAAGERLLDALEGRLPSEGRGRRDGALHARFPAEPPDPSLPDEERLTAASPLDAVRALAGLVEDRHPGDAAPPGVYGALSYEIVDCWETLPPRAPDPMGEPDVNVVFALDAVLFDHLRGEVRVVTRSLPGADDAEAEARHQSTLRALKLAAPAAGVPEGGDVDEKDATPDVSDDAFRASVRKFLGHIRAGDIFQGVLSRGLEVRSPAAPLDVYEALRGRNPSPYMFHVDLGDGVLLGASPETSVKVEGREVEIRPIAGTAPRGFRPDLSLDPELDTRLAVGLLLDRKEQAEHVMLVDLARNDVARVSVPGTRRVTDPFCIEKYSHVQHLVSRVKGTLLPHLDALHAYRASANMGTLTGAPKLRAMELIRETEPFARGFYGGAVGYLLQDGSFDSCIVIRSLRHRDGRYRTRTGAGIVADSTPDGELEETAHKARACLAAVARAERGLR